MEEKISKISVELGFVSIGCNRSVHCASWGQNGLIAYGGGNFVVIYDPKAIKIIHTLRGHKARVNSVKWLSNIKSAPENRWNSFEEEIVSASSDKTLIIWSKENNEWIQKDVLGNHKDSVTGIATLTFQSGEMIIGSCGADCVVNLWRRKNLESPWEHFQSFSSTPKMMECLALNFLPSTEIPLLAVAGVDTLIHLYVMNAQGQFSKVLALEGHLDWVRSLAFANMQDYLMLATCGQDNKIRLWKIQHSSKDQQQHGKTSLMETHKNDSISTTTISGKGHLMRVGGNEFSVILESLLSAHDEWVYSVAWHPPYIKEGKLYQPSILLSASMDKSMMIWEPLESNGIWMNKVHVGELGGNTLGFFGGIWSPNGDSVMAHGYNGAFHLWNQVELGKWDPGVVVSGHFGPVSDLSWDSNYDYIVSVSEDQTARLYAQWSRDKSTTWHEIARPQIHGYDLNCVTFVPNKAHIMVSGADEKVIRVFGAPETFVSTLEVISKIKAVPLPEERPLGANVPALGLSNKPLFKNASENNEEEKSNLRDFDDDVPIAEPAVYVTPPLEEHLLQSTLWPELHKLYGHPNELISLAANHKGTLIASSCKGSQPDHSAIRLWDTNTWKQVALLVSHTLAVAQMEFSHNDQYLLSVSRDRTFCIWDAETNFRLLFKVKGHERIIWSGTWSMNDEYLATGSRDKLVKVWTKQESEKQEWTLVSTLPTFASPVTAITFAPISNQNILAVGLEDGLISLWSFVENKSWQNILSFPAFICHVDTVRKLKFREKHEKEGLQLATCSTDYSVRLYYIKLSS